MLHESLSSEHRRYLLIGFCLLPALANLVISALVGWIMYGSQAAVVLWAAEPSVGTDTLGTCFFLPVTTCLIVTPIVRWHVRRGTVEPLAGSVAMPPWIDFAHQPLLRRAALLGLASLIVAGAASAALFSLLGLIEMEFLPFLSFKVLFSTLLAILFTPFIGLLALRDPVQGRSSVITR